MEKTVFITGGAIGIGAAAVRKFLSEGWKVAFIDISEENGLALVEELGSENLWFKAVDVKDLEAMQLAAKEAEEAVGPITALFCNAGIHRCNTMLDVDPEEFDLVVKTNIYGCFHTLRSVVPYIEANGGGSVVINDSDQWFVGKPNSFAYGLTKGALGQITRSLSIDLGPKNIRVNAVCAGTIRTKLVDDLFIDFANADGVTLDEYWEKENQIYARGSAGYPSEVAELVYFLSTDKASFCTGGHYLCDGGLVAR